MDAKKSKRDLRSRRDEAHQQGRRRRTGVRKEKRTILLTPRASLLLDTYAFGSGKEYSQVVEDLVLAYCSRASPRS